MAPSSGLDHFTLEDTRVTRRYFAKFAQITRHLSRVAAIMQSDGVFDKTEIDVIARYLLGVQLTFRALGYRYLFAGRASRAGQITLDRIESGFPVFSEIMSLANDAAQAERHLTEIASEEALKDQMIQSIIGDLELPSQLQFALSQRRYYEELQRGALFWARNDPQAIWRGDTEPGRRRYLVHWASYDSQINLPQIYLMEVEDSGRRSLPKDDRRWPAVQSHLMAQAVAGLKLLTIARGFDQDFDDLHPKRLRRLHVGPMYSSAFTQQRGPLRDVLSAARAPEGEDWALAWTDEDLRSDRVNEERSGWFGSVEREVFLLDPFAAGGRDSGASRTERSIILPQQPYQALAELRPAGFSTVSKYVVTPKGRVMKAR